MWGEGAQNGWGKRALMLLAHPAGQGQATTSRPAPLARPFSSSECCWRHSDPFTQAQEEWIAGFHSTLVDVNAVSKGTRTGGIRRFTAISVVGNYQARTSGVFQGAGSGDAREGPQAPEGSPG